ncbi:MAG: hypothetical protein PHQ80_01065 [Candidatus ainarchaeum sp.]|nr:hypothetical protein [Candidatus ainarchaeum sp.]MDD5095979.1 hypothetical protein [Candidatus ainarchaeum sp.]
MADERRVIRIRMNAVVPSCTVKRTKGNGNLMRAFEKLGRAVEREEKKGFDGRGKIVFAQMQSASILRALADSVRRYGRMGLFDTEVRAGAESAPFPMLMVGTGLYDAIMESGNTINNDPYEDGRSLRRNGIFGGSTRMLILAIRGADGRLGEMATKDGKTLHVVEGLVDVEDIRIIERLDEKTLGGIIRREAELEVCREGSKYYGGSSENARRGIKAWLELRGQMANDNRRMV